MLYVLHDRSLARRPLFWAAVLCLTGILLIGCSTNPPATGGETVQEFAKQMRGRSYAFALSGHLFQPDMRFPDGIHRAFEPAVEICKRQGGDARFVATQRFYGEDFPDRLRCSTDERILWELLPGYTNVRKSQDGTLSELYYLKTVVRPEVVTAEQLAEQVEAQKRRQDADVQAEAVRRERDATAAQIRSADLERKRTEFRQSMKPGDRFKWAVAGNRYATAYGMIVRFDGDLAYVQFENLKMGGSNLRFIKRAELEYAGDERGQAFYELP